MDVPLQDTCFARRVDDVQDFVVDHALECEFRDGGLVVDLSDRDEVPVPLGGRKQAMGREPPRARRPPDGRMEPPPEMGTVQLVENRLQIVVLAVT